MLGLIRKSLNFSKKKNLFRELIILLTPTYLSLNKVSFYHALQFPDKVFNMSLNLYKKLRDRVSKIKEIRKKTKIVF